MLENLQKLKRNEEFDQKEPQLQEPEENIQEELFDFKIDNPELSLQQSMIIQRTAFYTSLLGEDFLENLKESRNNDPRFDFLKLNHNHFIYFTQLIESYL